jgi:hypothetical protein
LRLIIQGFIFYKGNIDREQQQDGGFNFYQRVRHGNITPYSCGWLWAADRGFRYAEERIMARNQPLAPALLHYLDFYLWQPRLPHNLRE